MNVSYTAGIYIVESAGMLNYFNNYIEAKTYIDNLINPDCARTCTRLMEAGNST